MSYEEVKKIHKKYNSLPPKIKMALSDIGDINPTQIINKLGKELSLTKEQTNIFWEDSTSVLLGDMDLSSFKKTLSEKLNISNEKSLELYQKTGEYLFSKLGIKDNQQEKEVVEITQKEIKPTLAEQAESGGDIPDLESILKSAPVVDIKNVESEERKSVLEEIEHPENIPVPEDSRSVFEKKLNESLKRGDPKKKPDDTSAGSDAKNDPYREPII